MLTMIACSHSEARADDYAVLHSGYKDLQVDDNQGIIYATAEGAWWVEEVSGTPPYSVNVYCSLLVDGIYDAAGDSWTPYIYEPSRDPNNPTILPIAWAVSYAQIRAVLGPGFHSVAFCIWPEGSNGWDSGYQVGGSFVEEIIIYIP